jgi:hypothetical protein
MREWALIHGKDGFSVRFTKVPAWAYVLEHVLDAATPCLHPERDWSFRVGFGRKSEDGWRARSLGDLLIKVCDARDITGRTEKLITTMPISPDLAHVLEPQWAAECERIFGDDEERALTTDDRAEASRAG